MFVDFPLSNFTPKLKIFAPPGFLNRIVWYFKKNLISTVNLFCLNIWTLIELVSALGQILLLLLCHRNNEKVTDDTQLFLC